MRSQRSYCQTAKSTVRKNQGCPVCPRCCSSCTSGAAISQTCSIGGPSWSVRGCVRLRGNRIWCIRTIIACRVQSSQRCVCRKLLLLRNDKLTLRIFSIRSLISQRRTYSFRKMAHRRYLRPGLPYRTLKILQMSPRLWHPFTRTICTSADDGREKSILFLSRLHVYIWSVCIWRISFLFMLWFTTGPMLFFRLHARTYLP